jgi:tRNA(Ile2) C34 agmatinyltransferase TiaS
MSDLPAEATTACPDCGTMLNDTDKDSAGLWCPQCRRYHESPAELEESRSYEAGYEAGWAAGRRGDLDRKTTP